MQENTLKIFKKKFSAFSLFEVSLIFILSGLILSFSISSFKKTEENIIDKNILLNIITNQSCDYCEIKEDENHIKYVKCNISESRKNKIKEEAEKLGIKIIFRQ